MNLSKKLTKKVVESIAVNPSKEIFFWDTEIKGFGVRIFQSGRKTYFIQYRNNFNRTKRKKIGVHGAITTEQAREQAKILLGAIAKGEDPSVKVTHKALHYNMNELAQKYMELYAKHEKQPKSITEDQSMLDLYILKTFGNKLVTEVSTEDIQVLHAKLHTKSTLPPVVQTGNIVY